MFFFFGFSKVFMIVLFGYTINHLINNTSIIYGSIIVITIYIFILSSMFYYSFYPKNFGDEGIFFIHRDNSSNDGIIINTILFP